MLHSHSLETIDGAFVIYRVAYEYKQYPSRGAPSWHHQEHFYAREITATQIEKICLELPRLYRNVVVQRILVATRLPMSLPPV